MSDQVEQNELMTQVEMTTSRLTNQVGHTAHVRHKIIQPVVAAQIIVKEKFTINPDLDSKEMEKEGIRDIWEYILFRNPIGCDTQLLLDPSNRERFESMRDHRKLIRQAFVSFRKHVDVDWRRHPLLMIPRYSHKKGTEVITFDRNLLVNECETAGQVYAKRMKTHFKAHTKAFLEKEAVISGIEALHEFKEWLTEYIRNGEIGLRQPLLSFSEETPMEALARACP